jgi:hypothetical protein
MTLYSDKEKLRFLQVLPCGNRTWLRPFWILRGYYISKLVEKKWSALYLGTFSKFSRSQRLMLDSSSHDVCSNICLVKWGGVLHKNNAITLVRHIKNWNAIKCVQVTSIFSMSDKLYRACSIVFHTTPKNKRALGLACELDPHVRLNCTDSG